MSEHLRQELSDQFARIGKALGNGRRLELLELLSQGERSVEALAHTSGLSVANTSQHLQQLRQAGLVEGHKTGQHVYYSLADPRVVSLLELVHQLAESRLAEVSRLVHNYLGVHDELEPVTPDDLLQRAQEGLVTVLDVRPPEEFEAGHLPGAVNIPLEELEERLPELARDREVIAYCRGPYCLMAYEAVEQLRSAGFSARRLREGYPQWREGGWPEEDPESSEDIPDD